MFDNSKTTILFPLQGEAGPPGPPGPPVSTLHYHTGILVQWRHIYQWAVIRYFCPGFSESSTFRPSKPAALNYYPALIAHQCTSVSQVLWLWDYSLLCSDCTVEGPLHADNLDQTSFFKEYFNVLFRVFRRAEGDQELQWVHYTCHYFVQADNDFLTRHMVRCITQTSLSWLAYSKYFLFFFFIQGLPGTNGLPGGVGPQGPAVSNCHATLGFQDNQHELLSPVLLAKAMWWC